MASYYVTGLPISSTELVGPKTNSRTVVILHPDRHVSSETGHTDNGAARIVQRLADRHCYLPTHRLSNIYLRNVTDANLDLREIYDDLGHINIDNQIVSKVTAWDDIVYVNDNYTVGSANETLEEVPSYAIR